MNFSGRGNTLLDGMAETCTIIEKRTVKDLLGGYTTAWADGTDFLAVIIKNDTTEAKIAEKQGVTEIYKVVVQKGFPLEHHDVFRREATGEIFRVTSNIADKQAPNASTVEIGYVNAERWTIPDA